MYGLGKEVRKMEKLYFILSLILLSIITVINIESDWRFIEVEFLTGLLIMAPDFIDGLCRDIAAIIEDSKEDRNAVKERTGR